MFEMCKFEINDFYVDLPLTHIKTRLKIHIQS